MKQNVLIDEIDGYTQYGVSVIASSGGSYRELITCPSLKKVPANDWPEEDGIEVDLSEPVLDTMKCSLRFVCEHGKSGIDAFFDRLNDGAYHVFEFPEIDRSYKLRVSAQPNLTVSGDYRVFSLQFENDFPLAASYSYSPPQSTYVLPNFGILLDGKNIRNYGIGVTGDWRAEIYRAPEVKNNLTQSVDNRHGVVYDDGQVKYKSKEVRLNMLMAANSIAEFWNNRDAFLYDLVRPNLRNLTAGTEVLKCYYKSCSTESFYVRTAVFHQFTLSLIFTSYRP
ncbi:MAG: hypothetical protein LBB90_07690 [Tannerella sp.]|jgi:hypothetical protein|nr:hypothetical protein [Tannerella sp.]